MDYGFPSGIELVEQILHQIKYWDQPGIAPAERAMNRQMMTELGVDEGRTKELQRLIESTPTESIDQLLEKRNEFIVEGKFFIALALIDREQPSNLNSVKQRRKSWYQYLWRYIEAETAQEIGNNKLSIITYNYDRSIDFFLRQAVTGLYNVSDEKAALILSNIPVMHLHGQLGCLSIEGKPGGRPYNGNRDMLAMREAMQGIRIIHESENYHQIPEFQRAADLLESAQKILVLGFGYHPVNIQRLGLGKFDLIGTTHGLRGAELNRLLQTLPKLKSHDMLIYEFLRTSALGWT
jgi:hypothetical protein